MSYLYQIQKLDSDTFTNMHKVSQLTIDLIQDLLIEFSDIENENDADAEMLGALMYNLDNVIEVINPTLSYDVFVLTKLKTIVTNWYNQVEFINRSLGINLN